jgi:hypothetical protein
VFTTHRHDDLECSSPRDYVDTKSRLAYEQNPYSINWVRSGSCHRETSPCYGILSAITRLQANTNIRFLHDAQHLDAPISGAAQPTTSSTTLSCSAIASMTWQHYRQHDSTSTSRRGQVTSTTSSPAWPDSIVASMTQHLHRATVELPQQRHHQHDSVAPLLARHDIYIASWPSCPDDTISNMT